MTLARQWLDKHLFIAVDVHPTTEELLETMFPMQSILRLYNEDQHEKASQLWLRVNCEPVTSWREN
jgi:hypothetical protein